MNLEFVRRKERDFPAVDAPEHYLAAKIWHCSFRSLAELGRLVNLTDLEIASYPDDSLDLLSGLVQLRRLRIVHLPRIRNLAPLGHLRELRELALSTLPSWDASGKHTEVDSLRPLAQLHHLESLELAGIVVADGGLRPLYDLHSLRSVRLGNLFSIQDFAGLRIRNPELEGTFLTPTVELPFSKCARCGSIRVMLSGVPKYNLKCPRCHAKRIAEHLARWREAEASAV